MDLRRTSAFGLALCFFTSSCGGSLAPGSVPTASIETRNVDDICYGEANAFPTVSTPVGNIYTIPSSDIANLADECRIRDALASGWAVVGYDDNALVVQSLVDTASPVTLDPEDADSVTQAPAALIGSVEDINPSDLTASASPMPSALELFPNGWKGGAYAHVATAAYLGTDGAIVESNFNGESDAELQSEVDAWLSSLASDTDGVTAQTVGRSNVDASERRDTPCTVDSDAGDCVAKTLQQSAWLRLGDGTQTDDIADGRWTAGQMSTAYTLYRLNTVDPNYDWFLVSLRTQLKTNYWNGCNTGGTRGCWWFNVADDVTAYMVLISNTSNPIGTVTAHSPNTPVTSGTYTTSSGFTVGAQAACTYAFQTGNDPPSNVMGAIARPRPEETTSPTGSTCSAGISGSYSTSVSETWNISSLSTYDETNNGSTSAEWKDAFNTSFGSNCQGTPPGNTISSGGGGKLIIFRVPRSALYGSGNAAQTVGILVHVYAEEANFWTWYGSCIGNNSTGFSMIIWHDSYFSLPQFNVYTSDPRVAPAPSPAPALGNGTAPSVTLTRGGSVTLYVTSRSGSPDWGLAFAYQPTDKNGNPLTNISAVGLSATKDFFSNVSRVPPQYATLTLSATKTATPGTYYVLFDTNPAGEADQVRSGPIPVQVVVK